MGKKIYAGMQKTSMKDYVVQLSSVGLVVFLLVTFFPTRDYLAERIFAIYSLDINPSIVIKVGEHDNVLSIEGLNKEAREMLGNFQYYERNIEDVVSDIVEEAIEVGYVHNQRTNYFLLSKLTMEGEVATGGEELVDLIYYKVRDLIDAEAEVHLFHGRREAFVEGVRNDMSPGMVLLKRDFEARNIQFVKEDDDRIDMTNRQVEVLVQQDAERPNYRSEKLIKSGEFQILSTTMPFGDSYAHSTIYSLEVGGRFFQLDFSRISSSILQNIQSGTQIEIKGRYNSSREVIQVSEVQIIPTTAVAATGLSRQADSRTRQTAVVLVNYSTQKLSQINRTNANNAVFGGGNSVKSRMSASSYGRLNFTGNVYEVTLNEINRFVDTHTHRSDVYQAVRTRIDTSKYHHILMIHPNPGSRTSAYGGVGCSSPPCRTWIPEQWASSYFPNIWNEWVKVMVHELGHNLGMHHSSLDRNLPVPVEMRNIGFSESQIYEYGDQSCPMGFGSTMFNAPQMNNIGLLNSSQVNRVTSNGTYTIASLSTNPNSTNHPQLLQIPKGGGRFYTVSYRQHSGADSQINCQSPGVNRCMPSRFTGGASIHESPSPNGFTNSHSQTTLLRVLSNSLPNWSSGGISVRQTSRTNNTVTVNISGLSSQVTRSLTIQSQGVNNARITATPSKYSNFTNITHSDIEDGKEITLVAQEFVNGARFQNWGGNNCQYREHHNNRSIVVTMTRNMTCVANYETASVNKYSVEVKVAGLSQVSISSSDSRFNNNRAPLTVPNIDRGTQVTLTAPSISGFKRFSGWTGTNCNSSNRTISFTVDSNMTCTANYGDDVTRTLTVNSNVSVNITGDPTRYGGNADNSYQRTGIPTGTEITLTAPHQVGGQNFIRWEGIGCNHNQRVVRIAMTSNRTCTAVYQSSSAQTYTLRLRSEGASLVRITTNPTQYGKVTPYNEPIPSGTKVTITAPEVSNGATFTGWSGSNCSNRSRTQTIIMDRNRTCIANYGRAPSVGHTLRVHAEGPDSVNITASPSTYSYHTNYRVRDIQHGRKIQLTAPARVGDWRFVRWTGDNCSSTSRTIPIIMNGDRHCIAEYRRDSTPPSQTHTLRVQSSGPSDVRITGNPSNYGSVTNYWFNNSVPHNRRIELTAPNTVGDWRFVRWTGDNCSSSNRKISFTMQSNRRCVAEYRKDSTPPSQTHTLRVQSSGPSDVRITGNPSNYGSVTNYIFNNTVPHNQRIELTAPNTVGDWRFVRWTGDNCSSSNRTITFNMRGNRRCIAEYRKDSTTPGQTHTLRVHSRGASDVRITGNPSNYGSVTNYWFNNTVPHNRRIELTAPTRVGEWQFVGWSRDGDGCQSSSPTVSIVMRGDRWCIAEYQRYSQTPQINSEISLLTYINNVKYDNNQTITVSRGSSVDISFQSDVNLPTDCEINGLVNRTYGALGWARIHSVQTNGFIEINCNNNNGAVSRRFNIRVN